MSLQTVYPTYSFQYIQNKLVELSRQKLNYADLPDQEQSDWTETDINSPAYIKNKPTIPSVMGDVVGPSSSVDGDVVLFDGTTGKLIKDSGVAFTDVMLKSVYDTDNSGVVDKAEGIAILGRNSTGATLYKGSIVYISGSTGNRPNFTLSRANTEATSAGTFGMVLADMPNNTDGYVMCAGFVDNLDTRTTAPHPITAVTLSDGDKLYLDPNNAGYVTNVKPSAPNHLVYIGVVTRTSPTNGTIVLRIQNGYELEELHNVSITSPTNGQALVYDSSTSLWKNQLISGAGDVYGPAYSNVDGIVVFLDTTGKNLKDSGMNLSQFQQNIHLTTTGNSGAATFNGSTCTLNVPNYTLAGLGGISLTALSASSPLSYNSSTGAFSIQVANTSQNGYLSSSDWNTFNGKQSAITLTTTGNSGAATLVGSTLNIPNHTIDGLLPSQTGNNGKYLTTNGTSASWASTTTSSSFTDITSLCTFVGWSSTTEQKVYSYIVGNLVIIQYRIVGTSNSTSANVTLPYTNSNVLNSCNPITFTLNNGSLPSNFGTAIIQTNSSVLLFSRDNTGTPTNWTASGTKQVNGQIAFYKQ